MKQEIVTVGLDLAKSVFQVHAIGGDGTVLVRRKLRRAEVIGFFTDLPSCLVGIEACASAHHWARELIKLGHDVRLMPPAYVKPYVKRGKTDAADAEAICEAVTRTTMRLVSVKTVEQQAVLMLHKSRDLMVRARLIKLTDTEHVLTLVMHHIAGDGVSMGVFCKELTQAYQTRTSGQTPDQAPDWTALAVSYADHAAWQRAWLESSGELERQSQSWQAQLAGIPERLSLPTDHPREASRSRAARYLPIEISAQITAQLQTLANRHQTTLFTVLIALYGTLLGRLANQSDVVIGAPVAGRARRPGLAGPGHRRLGRHPPGPVVLSGAGAAC
jgi:hypothetical protein